MSMRQQCANAIRILSMDAVEKARSGHPGMPMGMADIAQVLWCDVLKHHPARPQWFNRDRFVLSNGHGSMLLYSVLHLSGYDLSLDDLKQFRQLHSKTAGHPEYGYAPGIDTTTGPLGNGIANAVGMALAERRLAAMFNRPNYPLIDHYTYAFVGDGCLMEGVCQEAISLAGTQQLNKLIVVWDDNGISIDGPLAPWFNEDVAARFEACNWHVIRGVDGHDGDAIQQALHAAQAQTERPTLICAKTVIGFGAPSVAGTAHTHGSPLGAEEIKRARQFLQWESDEAFYVPPEIYAAFDGRAKGEQAYQAWETLLAAYGQHYPHEAALLMRLMQGDLPADFEQQSAQWIADLQIKSQAMATRAASQRCIEWLTPYLPECVGGSADLSVSNLTSTAQTVLMTPENPAGNYLEYGVREFGMSAIMNGLALHGGIIPFGGTFLVFSDYARSAVRLAALMQIRVIFVYTHDSIGLGEDGPTHQPIEHLASLRLIPNLHVWRPCDEVETAVAWQQALLYRNGPSALALSRQAVPAQSRSASVLSEIVRGGYVLSESAHRLQCVILASGTEVSLAIAAQATLEKQGIGVRVVSFPCFEVFDAQPLDYQASVLPPDVPRIAVEAGAWQTWLPWVKKSHIVGLRSFGLSAPAAQVYNELGITQEAVVQTCLAAVEMGV